MSKIVGNLAGCYSPMGKTFILVDEDGNELSTAVVVDQETVFDVGTNDVRKGKVYAGNEGVKTGTKNIPGCQTRKGSVIVFSNESYSIPLSNDDLYDYTKFQCAIAKFNTSFTDSVETNKVSLEDNVYEVNSATPLSRVTKNSDTGSIDLNITNNTEDTYIIHYFTFKEEY